MKPHTFKIGDIVRLKKQNQYGPAWKGKMTVHTIWGTSGDVSCEHPRAGLGCFSASDLKLHYKNKK